MTGSMGSFCRTTIAGMAAAFWHLGVHHANSFLGSILFAVVLIPVGGRADGEWAKIKTSRLRVKQNRMGAIMVTHNPKHR